MKQCNQYLNSILSHQYRCLIKIYIDIGIFYFYPEVNVWTEYIESMWYKILEQRSTEAFVFCNFIIVL